MEKPTSHQNYVKLIKQTWKNAFICGILSGLFFWWALGWAFGSAGAILGWVIGFYAYVKKEKEQSDRKEKERLEIKQSQELALTEERQRNTEEREWREKTPAGYWERRLFNETAREAQLKDKGASRLERAKILTEFAELLTSEKCPYSSSHVLEIVYGEKVSNPSIDRWVNQCVDTILGKEK
jgi:hypothetical protein